MTGWIRTAFLTTACATLALALTDASLAATPAPGSLAPVAVARGVATASVSTAAATAAGPLRFTPEVMVDEQRATGEPSLSISPTLNHYGHHDIYVSTPYGFLTTASFVWKSEDGGQSFHLVAGQVPPLGKPNTCVGGGDSGIVNDKAGNLYFTDLQGLTDVSGSVSTDGGRTFTTTCNQANGSIVDRPWISVYGNPLTTGREYMTVDGVAQCTINCGLGQAGSNTVEVTQASGVAAQNQIFSPVPAQQIEPDGIVSGTVVNQQTGDLYIVHTGYTNNAGAIIGGSDTNGNDNAVIVDRFPKGYTAATATLPSSSISLCQPYNPTGPCQADTAFHAPLVTYNKAQYSSVTVGQDFSPMAIDSAGNLYVVWAQAPTDPASGQITGPSAIYVADSTNNGRTWGPPVDVSASVPALKTNVFPWIAAGAAGKIDIVWYGTTTLGTCPQPKTSTTPTCGSSNINGSWNVYLAQSLNAVTPAGQPNSAPHFTTTTVTQYPNHYGPICTFGIGCSTGGDRGLLDFLSVQVAPNGAADVVWADSANTDLQGGTSQALIGFSRQSAGPGLYGTTVSGPTTYTGTAPGSPRAYFAGLGAETPAPSNLHILSSAIYGPNAAHNYIVRMKVANLSSLTASSGLGGPDALWVTRWELPTAKPTHAVQGHVFYAAMESTGGAAPSFFAGESQTVGVTGQPSTQQGFYLTYAPQHAITGSYTTGSATTPGVITLTVPGADVGNPAGADLPIYSATGFTATAALPAATGNALFNLIDSTSPFDSTLPASVLTPPHSSRAPAGASAGTATANAQAPNATPARSAAASGALAFTGLDPAVTFTGLALLGAGLGGVVLTRRRRAAGR